MPGVEEAAPWSPRWQTTQPSLHSAQVGSRSPKDAADGTAGAGAGGRTAASTMVPTTTAISARKTRRSSRPEGIRRSAEDEEAGKPGRPDSDSPPGEERKAVARDVVEEALDHDEAGDEGGGEADRDQRPVLEGQGLVALGQLVGECPGHSRHGKEERELRRGALVGAHQH